MLDPSSPLPSVYPALAARVGPATVWRTGNEAVVMCAPTPERASFALYTATVSEADLQCPAGLPPDVPRRVELSLTLDASWAVEAVDEAQSAWPVLLLVQLSRHLRAGAWVSAGHVLQLAAPLSGTAFTHVVIGPVMDGPVESLRSDAGVDVLVYGVYPVTAREVARFEGTAHGGLGLLGRLLAAGVTERVDVQRPPVVTHVTTLH